MWLPLAVASQLSDRFYLGFMIVFAIDVISRIVHVSTAITLVGGSLFTLLVLMPSVKLLSESEHTRLAQAIGGRWRRWVHGGIALFLITGFYNYMRAMPAHQGDGLYHAMIGTKMLLALGVFFVASALVGRSAKLESIRQNRVTWLRVLVLTALVIVAVSGFLKVRGPQTPSASTTPPTVAPEL